MNWIATTEKPSYEYPFRKALGIYAQRFLSLLLVMLVNLVLIGIVLVVSRQIPLYSSTVLLIGFLLSCLIIFLNYDSIKRICANISTTTTVDNFLKTIDGQYSEEYIKYFRRMSLHLLKGAQVEFVDDQEVGPCYIFNRSVKYRDETYETRTAIYLQLGNTDKDTTVDFMRNLGQLPNNRQVSEFINELNKSSGLKYFTVEENGEWSLYQHSYQPLQFMDSQQKYENELITHDVGQIHVKPMVQELWQKNSPNAHAISKLPADLFTSSKKQNNPSRITIPYMLQGRVLNAGNSTLVH